MTSYVPGLEPFTRLDLRLSQEPWHFAERNREEIDRRWKLRLAENPRLWNGRTLLARTVLVVDGLLSARFSIIDYASYLVARDLGWPDQDAFNMFAMGIMRSNDGALVFAEMSPHTANAGMVYSPGGSLEPRDLAPDGSVNVDGSIIAEVHEETGLDLGSYAGHWRFAVFDGHRVALIKTYQLPLSFATIDEQFRRHALSEEHPELTRLVPVRSQSDISNTMPPWAQAVVRELLV